MVAHGRRAGLDDLFRLKTELAAKDAPLAAPQIPSLRAGQCSALKDASGNAAERDRGAGNAVADLASHD